MKTDEEIRREVEADFARFESDADPGVLTVLEAYGGAAAAYERAEQYLRAEAPEPVIITSDSSQQ